MGRGLGLGCAFPPSRKTDQRKDGRVPTIKRENEALQATKQLDKETKRWAQFRPMRVQRQLFILGGRNFFQFPQTNISPSF